MWRDPSCPRAPARSSPACSPPPGSPSSSRGGGREGAPAERCAVPPGERALNAPLAALFGAENLPVALALLAPLLAGVISFSFEETPAGRLLARVGMAAAAGGAGWALARTLSPEQVTWQGFTADPWRALLAAGALLTACASTTRGTPWSRAAGAVAAGAGAGAIFAPDALWLAVMLVASTAAYAVAAFTVSEEDSVRHRAMRSAGWLVVADFCAALGLVLAAGDGLRLPPSSDAAAALLLAAGAIRLGLAPAATEDAVASGLGAVWLGPVRAVGALLAGMAVAAGGARASALAALGAAMALGAAWRAHRERSAEALATVAAGVVAAGLGLGGPAGAGGAVLALAASFAAWPLWLARRAGGLAVPSLALAPAGATFAGAAMIGGAAMQAGAVRASYLAVAVPLLAAAGLAAVAAWRTREPVADEPRYWFGSEHAPDEVAAAESVETVPSPDETGLASDSPRLPGGDATDADGDDAAGEADNDEGEGDSDEGEATEVVVRRRIPETAFDAIWAVPAALVLVALVVQPQRIGDAIGVPAAAILGAGRLLGTDPFRVQDTLGVIMGVLAVLGLAAGSGPPATAAGDAVMPSRWSWWWLAPPPASGASEAVRRWGLVAAVAGAATVGLVARLLIVAGSRGFL